MKKIQVLLSTYNGEQYLRQQLDSIINQKNVFVKILVRDDGSTDSTIAILKEYKRRELLEYYQGENIGYRRSFMHLLMNVSDMEIDYYAFSDQDDVWLDNKLEMAVKKISNKVSDKPLLYASALQRVDENLQFMSKQSFRNLNISLGGEIARHRLAGCTYLFNDRLFFLIKKSYQLKNYTGCSHDELTALLCLASGGQIIYDSNSYILFRRHRGNASLDGVQIKNKLKEEILFLSKNKNRKSKFIKWVHDNYSIQLTTDAIDKMMTIINYRNDIYCRIKLLKSNFINSGFWWYDLFLKFLIICKKF